MNTLEIKTKLRGLVASLRKNECSTTVDATKPSSVQIDDIMLNGKPGKRRRIVLATHGCTVSTCTMCPLPDESVPESVKITELKLIDQIREALAGATEDIITVYTNGNFFSDREMPDLVRDYLYCSVRNIDSAKQLVVESLPGFITKDKIADAKNQLGLEQKLVVAIGIQSWNDEVRELAINSTCTKKAFLSAHAILASHGYGIQAFLMFKPPFLTVRESIDDVLDSVHVMNRYGVKDIVISPLRVAKNTLVQYLYDRGEYFPPSAWSLRELIFQLHNFADDSGVRIATSILSGDDGIDSIRVPVTAELLAAVKQYNINHDPSKLLDLFLHETNGDRIELKTTIPERIQQIL